MLVEFLDPPHASPSWALGLRPVPPGGSAIEFALWEFKGKVFRCWSHDPPLAGPAFPMLLSEAGLSQIHNVLSICDSAHYQGFLNPTDGSTLASTSRSGFAIWRVFVQWITVSHNSGWIFAWKLEDRFQHEVLERLRTVAFDIVKFDRDYGVAQRHWGWHVHRDVSDAFQ